MVVKCSSHPALRRWRIGRTPARTLAIDDDCKAVARLGFRWALWRTFRA